MQHTSNDMDHTHRKNEKFYLFCGHKNSDTESANGDLFKWVLHADAVLTKNY